MRQLFSYTFILLLTALISPYGQKTPQFEPPILISSAGQSADVKLAELLFKKLKIDAKTITMAKASDLTGIKTLVIVPGFSSKGLGAAGVSKDDELKRVIELVKEAEEKNIPIVVLHLGGNARRHGQSDDFNRITAEASEYMIVVEQGNSLKLPLRKKFPWR